MTILSLPVRGRPTSLRWHWREDKLREIEFHKERCQETASTPVAENEPVSENEIPENMVETLPCNVDFPPSCLLVAVTGEGKDMVLRPPHLIKKSWDLLSWRSTRTQAVSDQKREANSKVVQMVLQRPAVPEEAAPRPVSAGIGRMGA